MRERISSVFVFLLLIFSMFAVIDITFDFVGEVQGPKIYVNKSGSGGAYTSIQAAVDDAGNGYTIFVYSGSYFENLIVDKSLILMGENRDTTIINGSQGDDIIAVNSNSVTISGFTVTGGTGPSDAGIQLTNVQNCIINNNKVLNNTRDIFLWDSHKNEISNNNASSSEWYGVSLQSSSNNTVINNEIRDCFDGIILASGSENNEILYNDVSSSNQANIDIWEANDNFVANNTLTFSNGPGIQIIGSWSNFIFNNSVYNNDLGITVLNSTFNTIADNVVTLNNGRGIYLQDPSNNNTLTNNTISYNQEDGIELLSSPHNYITNNKISNNQYGIDLLPASNNTIVNNEIYSNNWYGIALRPSSNNNIIRNNDIYLNNNIGIYLWETSNYNIISNNSISDHDSYGIRVSTFSNFTQIENNTVSNNSIGISISSSSNSNITNNSIQLNGGSGVSLDSSHNNVIIGNNISFGNDGISFSGSTYNYVTQNNVTNNGDGIFLDSSSKNNITNNNISNNTDGIDLSPNSLNNTIISNNISNNGDGIYISSSSTNNTIYHNNFLNNTDQADDFTDYGNQWDDGYPSGGNYWSDYSGADDFRGPDQDIPGGDAIGDTNYSIDADSTDRYPLIDPYGTKRPVHNIDKDIYYHKIQDAVDDADPGNTIFVSKGTYYENVVLNRSINLVGENKENTIINGSGTGDTIRINADWVNVTGFMATGCGPSFNDAGIHLYYTQNCTITNNIVSYNPKRGIYLEYSSWNIVDFNIASRTDGIGIYLYHSHGNNLNGNNASQNSNSGIHLSDSTGNTISNSTANFNQFYGIVASSSDGNNITSNTVYSNYWWGIQVHWSWGNILTGNTVSSSKKAGIYLSSCWENTLTNNTLIDDGIYMWSNSLKDWNTHNIDTSNIVNGKPVYYWKNQTLRTIPNGAGQVILANCTNVKIEWQNLNNCSLGIQLGFSNYNNVTNNTVESNQWYGIHLVHSSGNNITGNMVRTNYHGILLFYSDGNNIANNTAQSNQWDGINIWSSDRNNITGNSALLNKENGINLDESHDNFLEANKLFSNDLNGLYMESSIRSNITGNTIHSNNETGIYMKSCSFNRITENNILNNHDGILISSFSAGKNKFYHNNFINNTGGYQAYDGLGKNYWNDTYPTGGNYWSDYMGVDNFKGPQQDIPGWDGFGDTNYTLGGNRRDYYPLMEPYGSVSILGSVHNVDKGTYYHVIQDAIDDADSGNTIFVRNGTYYENVVVNFPINLTGENKFNTIIDGGDNGDVILITGENVSIRGFTITQSGNDMFNAGIRIESNNNTVSDCEIFGNRNGVLLYYCSGNTISSNNFPGNIDTSIGIYYSDDNIVSYNNATLTGGSAISLYFSDWNYIKSNNASHSKYGIHIRDSVMTDLFDNVHQSNEYYGIYIRDSRFVNAHRNSMMNDGIFISGDSLEHWNTHFIATTNTVNGKPIYYRKNQNGGSAPQGVGQVIIANCDQTSVEDLVLMDAAAGVLIGFSNNVEVFGNQLSNCRYGISLYSSHGCTIEDNIAIYGESYGISLDNSNNNIVQYNNASDNYYGLSLWSSNGNYITNNSFFSNNQIGIRLWSSNSNKLYHNDIIDNPNQALDNSPSNQWDNGYPSGGNYWSDYTGSDDFSGPNQDISGSDKIGDSPYVIDADSQDNYPLMFSRESHKPVYNIDKDIYYHKIQYAINEADSGNTIFVKNGTYYENVIVDRTITLIGEDKYTTIIDGSERGNVILITANLVKVSGFTLQNSGEPWPDYHAGVELNNVQYCNVFDNLLMNNIYGIFSESSSNNNIENNDIVNNKHGMRLEYSSENNIKDNNVSYTNGYAINLYYSSHNTITGNNISDNLQCIYSWSSLYNKIIGNYVSYNMGGISFHSSSNNNMITGNIIINNTDGISVGDSIKMNITLNDFNNNGVFIWGDELAHYNSHNIPTNNMINGRPLYYYKDSRGIEIDGILVGQLILANCSDFDVRNLQINNTDIGVEIAFCMDIMLKGNNIFNNKDCIFLDSSSNILITENLLSSNHYGNGICLWRSSYNNITYNDIQNHGNGFYFYRSTHNNIIGNIVSSNYVDGFYIYSLSTNNIIADNTISLNGNFGINFPFTNCIDNMIYHNFFINNANQVCDNTNSGNQWDNGYPSG
ncbi:MAG: right-handed parallel beta-helix repeat-containing protein, partial [Thermoplasmata archaeon]